MVYYLSVWVVLVFWDSNVKDVGMNGFLGIRMKSQGSVQNVKVHIGTGHANR
jgi:hypothetical protein